MQDIDLSKIKNVHFVGIGGIGISAIVRMMIGEGKNVSGQDMQESEIINSLRLLGVDIKLGQSYENISEDTELIIYTIAIENYDLEFFKKIKNSHIKSISYPEALGLISKGKYTIAISGTHGKTTTTGMLAEILSRTGKDPTVIIGSLMKNKTNFIHGNSDLFLVEACEYKRSFLQLCPNILVITNIDNDHLDYYKDIEDIKSAFRELAKKVPKDGFIVCDTSDTHAKDVIRDLDIKVINYKDFFDKNLKLKIPGTHNKLDASMALAVADILEIDKNQSVSAICEFTGTWRRFEYKGKLENGVKIYDDYAHHPAEITYTLEAFREIYPKEMEWNITVVFQSHLYSRTKLLMEDFAKSFLLADYVIVLPIYFAREEDDGTVSAEILAKKINDYSKNAKSFDSFLQAEEFLKKNLKDMDEKNIIVTMGAGEAFKIAEKLLK